MQCILKDDTVYIVEVCRRPPGDLYTRFVELATGFDYSKTIINFVSGKNNVRIKQLKTDGFYARHSLMGDKQGYLTNITYEDDITEHLIEEFSIFDQQNFIENHRSEKVSILFMKFETEKKMKEISTKLYKYINFSYK